MSDKIVSEDVVSVEVIQLRKCLKRFDENLGDYINDDQRYKLGRVLTIIDASIQDTEQRKALKDLINNEWWGRNSSTRIAKDGAMDNPHTEIRGICKALGFELYKSDDCALPCTPYDYEEDVAKSYKKTIIQE
jgi:hypothetical protein